MPIKRANLFRWSGISAISAGVMSVALSLPVLGLENLWTHLAQGLLMIIGLTGVYAYQYPGIGAAGFAGFCFACIGTVLLTTLAGDVEAPGFILGGFSASLGFILLGLATWKRDQFPRWIAVTWIAGSIVGVPAVLVVSIAGILLLVSAMLFGAGFIGAGLILWTDRG